jgi:transposase
MIYYKFTLTTDEKSELINYTQNGNHNSLKVRNSHILLNSDQGNPNKLTTNKIADFLHISVRTIERVKKRFVEEGIDVCLMRKISSSKPIKKVDGEFEARLIALSCSEAPTGFAKWSLRLLADKMVELNYIESISHETIRRVLKKRIKTLES